MTRTDTLFTMRPLYSRYYTKAFVRILNDLYFGNVMYVKCDKCNFSYIILIYFVYILCFPITDTTVVTVTL